MATATPSSPDLFASWKELYDRFEGTWTQSVHEVLASESFASSMAATREQYLTSQQMSREGMEKYWENLRLTTKTDHAQLAAQVVNLENKIEGLEDQLEAMDARFSAVNTRLEAMESKLDALLNAVATLAAAMPEPLVTLELNGSAEQPAKRRRAK